MEKQAEELNATAVTVIERGGVPALPQEMSIEQVMGRVNKMHDIQKRVMRAEVHYGTIPGTPKPTLYKAGAEILCMTFMLDPEYEHKITQDGEHREIESRCILHHIPSGNRVGSGEGMCSTRESKYAFRKSSADCLACGKPLRRSKAEWYCWAKQGGCGQTYPLSDQRIKTEARVANPDLADQYNTVLKMANKRALVAAILNATAASEIFTQDLEDFRGNDTGEDDPPPPPPKPEPPPPTPPKTPTASKPTLTLKPDPIQPPVDSSAAGPAAAAQNPTPPASAAATPPPGPPKPAGVARMTDGQIKLVWARARQTGLVQGEDCGSLITVLNSFGISEPSPAGKTGAEIAAAMIAAIPPARLTQIVGAFGKAMPKPAPAPEPTNDDAVEV